jgi:hypothetical protein
MAGDDTGLTKLRNFYVGIGYIGRKIGGTVIDRRTTEGWPRLLREAKFASQD